MGQRSDALRKCRTTVGRSLDALLRQQVPARCEIVFVFNSYHEADDSAEAVHAHPLLSKWEAVEISGPGSGLAGSYILAGKPRDPNTSCSCTLIAIRFAGDALRRMVECLERNDVMAVEPLISIPQNDWKMMSFWDRVTSSQYRHAKFSNGFSGKFDMFRRDVLIKLGGYDDEFFSPQKIRIWLDAFAWLAKPPLRTCWTSMSTNTRSRPGFPQPAKTRPVGRRHRGVAVQILAVRFLSSALLFADRVQQPETDFFGGHICAAGFGVFCHPDAAACDVL